MDLTSLTSPPHRTINLTGPWGCRHGEFGLVAAIGGTVVITTPATSTIRSPHRPREPGQAGCAGADVTGADDTLSVLHHNGATLWLSPRIDSSNWVPRRKSRLRQEATGVYVRIISRGPVDAD